MTAPCCPTCGAPVSGDRVLVTLEANTITFRDHTIKVTSKQAELLSMLAKAMPRAMPYDALIVGMYGQDEPDYAHKCLQVFVCILRRDLRALKLGIETVRGRSYCLVEQDVPPLPKKKLTEDDVRGIRACTMSCSQAGALWGISRQNVSQIRSRRSWKHVS